jgi:hypothetical protein
MSTAGLVLYLSSGRRTRRSVTTASGSSSEMRFNRSQAESMFGGNMSMLEKYSVTLQYFIREGEERGQRSLLLASARQVFGTPTQQVIEKINKATSEKLLAWNTRLRTAQSWSELITE